MSTPKRDWAKEWSKRFAAYLERHSISRVEAAVELVVSTATIHNWLHCRHPPSAPLQKRVEKWSHGYVRQVPGTGTGRGTYERTGTDA